MRAEVNISDFMGRGNGQVRHLEGQNFRFYSGWKKNTEKSKEEGRLVADSIHMIEIINFAGDRTPREVQDRDKFAYPEAWQRYLDSQQTPTTGTPLSTWPILEPARLAELEHLGFRVVEDLAAISDEQVKKIPSLEDSRRMATNWLNAANSKQAEITKLKEHLHKANKKAEKLEEQLALAHKRIEAEGS